MTGKRFYDSTSVFNPLAYKCQKLTCGFNPLTRKRQKTALHFVATQAFK